MLVISLYLAGVVFIATMAIDFIYVMFSLSVAAGRRVAAATYSMMWHLVSALVVVVYTKSLIYLAPVALGSWIGSFFAMGFSKRKQRKEAQQAAAALQARRVAPKQLAAPPQRLGVDAPKSKAARPRA
jgi:hypothetical protein